MIRVKLAVCGQDVVRDAASNNISVFNVYEGVTAEGFPLLMSPFAFLVVLERDLTDPVQHAGRFELRLGDTVLGEGAMTVDFEDKKRTRQIIKVGGLVLPV